MKGIFIKGFICIIFAAFTLYLYIEKQNTLIELQLVIPVLSKEVHVIRENNTRLKYEIERLENPVSLMEILKKPEFSHLKYPRLNEEIIIYDETRSY